jgi:hypothetical protein
MILMVVQSVGLVTATIKIKNYNCNNNTHDFPHRRCWGRMCLHASARSSLWGLF